MTLGQRIRELRDARDISLHELAKQLGCSAAYWSDVELGRLWRRSLLPLPYPYRVLRSVFYFEGCHHDYVAAVRRNREFDQVETCVNGQHPNASTVFTMR